MESMSISGVLRKTFQQEENLTLDQLADKTYHALLAIVQTTPISKRVLMRPPFTFLHKLLVETLAGYRIFSAQQLDFSQLVSKEDKAAFLTRALAFVTYANEKLQLSRRVSCLLLVSPVRILAGVNVEDTHEFLLQLCEVCKSANALVKEKAAQEVIEKGDAVLYTSGVKFRKGILTAQALVRGFIRRRRLRQREEECTRNGQLHVLPQPASAPNGSSNHAVSSSPKAARTAPAVPVAPVAVVGTRFSKDCHRLGILEGEVRSIHQNHRGNVYVLHYAHQSTDEEVGDHEMQQLLEHSKSIHQAESKDKPTQRRSSRVKISPNPLFKNNGDVTLVQALPDLSGALQDARADALRVLMPSRSSSLRNLHASGSLSCLITGSSPPSSSSPSSIDTKLVANTPTSALEKQGSGLIRRQSMPASLQKSSSPQGGKFRALQAIDEPIPPVTPPRNEQPPPPDRKSAPPPTKETAAPTQEASYDASSCGAVSTEKKNPIPWQVAFRNRIAKGQQADVQLVESTKLASYTKSPHVQLQVQSTATTTSQTTENSACLSVTSAAKISPYPSVNKPKFPEFGLPAALAPATEKRRKPTLKRPNSLSTREPSELLTPATPSAPPSNSALSFSSTSPSSIGGNSAILNSGPGHSFYSNVASAAVNETTLMGTTSIRSLKRMNSSCLLLTSPFGRKESFAITAVDSVLSTYSANDQKDQERSNLFRDVVHRMENYMKRKRLRVIDLFRFCDSDGNGTISPEEMIDTLTQLEIHLNAQQTHEFLAFIDKDGNGSIDIDEFEELVRFARRNEHQQRDHQAKREHTGASGSASISALATVRKAQEAKQLQPFRALAKHKQLLYDAFNSIEGQDVDYEDHQGLVNATLFRSAVQCLAIANVSEKTLDALIKRLVASTNKGNCISFKELVHILEESDGCKANRFLDPSWLSQFDSQLERATREFELL